MVVRDSVFVFTQWQRWVNFSTSVPCSRLQSAWPAKPRLIQSFLSCMATLSSEITSLPRLRQRWRSIVMSTSVCVSVCLWLFVCPQGYPRDHTRDLYQFFCACRLWPSLCPPPAGWRNPKEKRQLWSFLPIDSALYSRAFGTHTKMAEPIKMPFGVMTRVGRRYHVLDGGPDPLRGRGNFVGEN